MHSVPGVHKFNLSSWYALPVLQRSLFMVMEVIKKLPCGLWLGLLLHVIVHLNVYIPYLPLKDSSETETEPRQQTDRQAGGRTDRYKCSTFACMWIACFT